ncbi:hypothetical protein MMC20_007994 [Loxospora ochrophaea]|nr:hypothetical protein [Loxospora ochrophaea]
MGQGFFGYSPPDFVLDAARETVYRADCHQYSPTKGRPRLLKAVAKVYSTMLDREINHRNEVAITTGANEGLFSALMAFVDTGDEVIILEPFFN